MRQYVIFDDITGEAGAAARHVLIGGSMYEIDLTDEGYDELVELLAPYVKAGRKVARLNATGTQLVNAGSGTPARDLDTPYTGKTELRHNEDEVKALRLWAKKNHVAVRESGRIRARQWAAFRADDLSLLKPEDFVEGKAPKEQLELAQTA